MSGQENGYQALLLRLWRETDRGLPRWRATALEIATGREQGFADLKALIAYLERLTGEAPAEPDPRRQG